MKRLLIHISGKGTFCYGIYSDNPVSVDEAEDICTSYNATFEIATNETEYNNVRDEYTKLQGFVTGEVILRSAYLSTIIFHQFF